MNRMGSRAATLTDTRSAGGTTAFCMAAGRDWIITNDATVATSRMAMGRMTFNERAISEYPGVGDTKGNVALSY
jgi:hypothetical protein